MFGRRRVVGWVGGEGSSVRRKAKDRWKRRELKRRRMVRRMKHRELTRHDGHETEKLEC